MPFLSDTTWPAGLLEIFDICSQEAESRHGDFENRYNGPYNKLLTYCFGPDSFEFFVAAQPPPADTICYCDDILIYFVVFDKRRRPVLIVDIKDDAWAYQAGQRIRANDEMRGWLSLWLDDCPLPRLWGLSLIGTSLRVYPCDVDTPVVDLIFVENHPWPGPSHKPPSDFLEGAWDIDILSKEGFDKMKEIVGEIIEALVE